MPGTRDIGLGALIFLVGAGITVASLANSGGGVIAYGAVLVGLLMIAKGVAVNLQHKKALKGATDGSTPAAQDTTITRDQAHEMMDLVVGLAGADGKLEQSERLIVRAVARDVFAMEMSDEDVTEVHARLAAKPHSFEAGLYRLQGKIPMTLCRLMLRYAAMVAYADGELAPAEQAALAKIAEILSIPEEARAEEMKAAFDRIRAIVIEQQQAG